MTDFVASSAFFGVLISLGLYQLGVFLKKKLKNALVNPLLIAIAGTIICLLALKVDYADYSAAAKPLSFLLTPATVCLAIPLYRQLPLMKKCWKAVIGGIFIGVVTSLLCIFLLAVIFSLDHSQYATLLPKSMRCAIGMGVSAELGGIETITVAVIVLTGIAGNVLAEPVCRLFRITDDVAKGIAIGTSAHAIGTARALEMGQVTGAMSGLAIAVAGIITVIFAPVFAGFI